MRTMTSMELDDEEKLDAVMPVAMSNKPDFPYGLRICLTEKEMEKLGCDPADAIEGGMVEFEAIGRITSVLREERDGKKTCRIEIQIEALDFEGEEDEAAAA